MFNGDESAQTLPSAADTIRRVRNSARRSQDYVYFGSEPSNLRWDEEKLPPTRLNWRSEKDQRM